MATTITQDMRFRLSVVLWAQKHGVTSAAIRYKKNRQFRALAPAQVMYLCSGQAFL